MNNLTMSTAGVAVYQPPSDIAAEMATLAGLITNNREALDAVSEMITPGDFYREANGIIFEVMLHLAGKNDPVDEVTVADELRRRGVFEQFGGRAYLVGMVGNAPRSDTPLAYASIVRDKAIRRRLIEAAATINGLAYSDAEDAESLIDSAEEAVSCISGRVQGDVFTPLSECFTDESEAIEARGNQNGEVVGINTGLSGLNDIMQGWQNGNLYIIAARPAMGKSAFATTCALHAACQSGKTVAVFSLEMSREQITQRIISAESGVPLTRILSGNLTTEEWQRINDAIGRHYNAPLFIDDKCGGLTIDAMRRKLRRFRSRKGLDMIVVDYIQLMRANARRGRGPENRNQEISEISSGLKEIGRTFEVPVLALSQLSREVERRENKRPMLSDLRDSGSLEADADGVLFLYRAEYYAAREEAHADVARNITDSNPKKRGNLAQGSRASATERETTDPEDDGIWGNSAPAAPTGDEQTVHETECILAKQRMGATGIVKMAFFPELTRFGELDRRHQY